jgi:hypothetical protein
VILFIAYILPSFSHFIHSLISRFSDEKMLRFLDRTLHSSPFVVCTFSPGCYVDIYFVHCVTWVQLHVSISLPQLHLSMMFHRPSLSAPV